jgi:hypothetical protein
MEIDIKGTTENKGREDVKMKGVRGIGELGVSMEVSNSNRARNKLSGEVYVGKREG